VDEHVSRRGGRIPHELAEAVAVQQDVRVDGARRRDPGLRTDQAARHPQSDLQRPPADVVDDQPELARGDRPEARSGVLQVRRHGLGDGVPSPIHAAILMPQLPYRRATADDVQGAGDSPLFHLRGEG
jgi:hypothetical protein